MWVQKLTAGVAAIAFAPDGRTLYVADRGRAVTAWGTITRTCHPLFKPTRNEHAAIVRLLIAGAGRYLVALVGRAMRAYDLETGAERARLELPGIPRDRLDLPAVREMVPLPGTEPRVVYAAEDCRSLLVWVPNGREPGAAFAGPFEKGIWSYDLSPDGRTVAVLYVTEAVVLFDPLTGVVSARFPIPRDQALGTNRVKFTPDGQSLMLFHLGHVQRWDAARGEPVGPAVRLGGRNRYETTAFHPTARVFAAINDSGHPTLFDLDTGAALRALDFQLGTRATCLTFSPDGLTCAIGGSNKQFAVFDVDL
ncbi:hypothetical protein R5W23_005872 [Gemmata sp. JC673]|uniref:WD40 repeat domain-containing protein n=1 Tax=Gemmata algarum TaxID=2975278 RepID=A0ABU5ERS5_9BACT|nr:hypothetical protein [Gemmata algarum]MDY3557905.1 hypothetical protein [Gemmata algarum]